MAERVDVSRLSVAECMALGGGAGEPAKEEGLQGKLEKLVQEIGLEVEGVDRYFVNRPVYKFFAGTKSTTEGVYRGKVIDYDDDIKLNRRLSHVPRGVGDARVYGGTV